MSVNRFQNHLLVLPEDDANRQIANGFQLRLDHPSLRRMQVLPEAGGWLKVLERFQTDHLPTLENYSKRHLVLLVDFDESETRLNTVKAAIPEKFKDRVFVLGTWSEPEGLKGEFGSLETIGVTMAKDCRENTEVTWAHPLLRHNASELERLRRCVRPFLFET